MMASRSRFIIDTNVLQVSSFLRGIYLDSHLFEILSKVSSHLIQMIKVHPLVTFNWLNDTTPDWLSIISFGMLDPDANHERMNRVFNRFHGEPMDFSFLPLRGLSR